jgi:hypothetical protein
MMKGVTTMKLRSVTAKILALVLAYAMLTLSVSADLASTTPPPLPDVYPTFTASHVERSMNGVATIQMIDGVQYAFDSSGANLGAYSGWMFRGPQRYFAADGIVQTGWHQIGDNGYFFNRDGVMRTGSVMTEWNTGMCVYNFDENGVWDGKAALYTMEYAPKTLGDFLLDHEYPADRVYEARLRSDSPLAFDTQEISDIGVVLQILRDHADSALLFDEQVGGDVVVVDLGVLYRDDSDIMIRLMDEQRQFLAAPFLFFSKDKAGNSYWYTNYSFGIKLDDPGAYDKVLGLIREKKES